jgi:MoxR-like ATPase
MKWRHNWQEEAMTEYTTTAAVAVPTEARTLGTAALLDRAIVEVKRVVVGQDAMVERIVISLLAGGHVLLEGASGVAKTLAVRTLATVVGGEFTRLHFTSDLTPADVIGTRVWRPLTEIFDTERGPVFANFLLADEISRAPSRAQSVLLDAMADHQVSLGGGAYPLPDPFIVLATHTETENVGYPHLPEAQRDRFLFKIDVDHAGERDELSIVQRMSGPLPVAQQILSIAQILALKQEVRQVFVHDAIAHFAVQLVMATRHPPEYGINSLDGVLEHGISARGSLGLIAAARALAVVRGRDYALPMDVVEIAHDVLAHRLMLTGNAVSRGIHPRTIIDTVLSTVPLPRMVDTP